MRMAPKASHMAVSAMSASQRLDGDLKGMPSTQVVSSWVVAALQVQVAANVASVVSPGTQHDHPGCCDGEHGDQDHA